MVGSAYHKNTNTIVERGNGIIAARLRQRPQGRLGQSSRVQFAINNSASTLGDNQKPFFIDSGEHPRPPLSLPNADRTAGESPAHYVQLMRAIKATVRELLAAG